jgi:two-component system, NarL family, response regulator
MSSMSPIRVMLVDDHTMVRHGIRVLLASATDIAVVAEARDANEAVSLYIEHRPDVTLMDLRMPNGGGVEAIKRIREQFPRARFIVLTMFDGEDDSYRALDAGAQGYLLKDASDEQLAEAIRTVHRGGRHIPAEIALRSVLRASLDLTEREMEVLQLLTLGKSNRDIADQLSISEPTVKGHVYRIFNKLGVTSRTQAVLAAIERGLTSG